MWQSERDYCPGGVRVMPSHSGDVRALREQITNRLQEVGLAHALEVAPHRVHGVPAVRLSLSGKAAQRLAPYCETLGLAEQLHLDPSKRPDDLDTEILVAMLLAPITIDLPSPAELYATLRIRRNIVDAARRIRINFDTEKVDRPPDYWSFDEERGFLLEPGRSLVEGLQAAIHPDDPEQTYSFSCWRATEHIVLLAIAREAQRTNPSLYRRLTAQAETRALKGQHFDHAYVRAYGTPSLALPIGYYIPGDRIWFKNPDPESAAVAGYEGSYTFYLGEGEFADLWRAPSTYSLRSKCLAIYHWRMAVERGADGAPYIDEARAETLAEQALQPGGQGDAALRESLRLQGPPDQDGGGCIDPSRDHPRFVCQTTEDVQLPDLVAREEPSPMAAEPRGRGTR